MQYLINLFPSNPELPYNDLRYEIRCYGQSIQIGPFCWVLRTDLDSAEICAKLRYCIDDDDRIFVCCFEFWSGHNINQELQNWLTG